MTLGVFITYKLDWLEYEGEKEAEVLENVRNSVKHSVCSEILHIHFLSPIIKIMAYDLRIIT